MAGSAAADPVRRPPGAGYYQGACRKAVFPGGIVGRGPKSPAVRRRVHKCVFGVLAIESEPVDPPL